MVINSIESWGNELAFPRNHGAVTLASKSGSFIHGKTHITCAELYTTEFQLGAHWVHEESLQFATSSKNNNWDSGYVVEIREFQPASTPQFALIKSFWISSHNGEFSFSPVSFHASFVTQEEIVILGVEDSRILLRVRTTHPLYTPPGCFSPDGSFFACEYGVWEQKICVWKNISNNYVAWCGLQPQFPFESFSFSPTTSTILTWGKEGIQLLELGNCSTIPPTDVSNQHYKKHLVAYSADGAHIAMALQKGTVVKVLYTISNAPQQLLDTKIEILDIKIIDSTVFVAGRHRFGSWCLETGEPVHDHEIIATTDTTCLALSNDCSHLALATYGEVFLYDVQAQKILSRQTVVEPWISDLWFPPNGHQLWLTTHSSISNPTSKLIKFEKREDGKVLFVSMEDLWDAWPLVNRFSPHGWHIKNDSEWVVDLRGKKVLWLPLRWRVKQWQDVRWDGKFLALVHYNHLEPIIIEFQP